MNFLSVGFLASNGIVASKGLKDWLTRASFVAKTRGSPEETERYAKWALCAIEEQLANQTVDEVEWRQVPTVMTVNATHKEPKLLSPSGPHANSVMPSTVDHRADVHRESMSRCPPELKPFLHQAFELYDKDVAKGKRDYKQVSFIEMLNIARNLEKKVKTEKVKAALQANEGGPTATAPVAAAPRPPIVNGPLHPRAVPQEKRKRASVPDAPVTWSDAVQEVPVFKKNRVENAASAAAECASYFQDMISKDNVNQATEYRVFRAQSTDMERRYSRYEPTEEDIRPLSILETSLDFIVNKFGEKERQENRIVALKYLSEQLKGMRQDLRVQNIVTNFTVRVYEFHARICLEMGDVGEFNQCQASLKSFYQSRRVDKMKCHMAEFFVYRLVYLSLSKQYDSLSTELIEYTNTHSVAQCATLKQFLPRPKEIQQVLQLMVALDNGDTISALQTLFLFKKELQFLVQIYLPRMRVSWLYNILCGIRGKISLRFIMANLGFLPSERAGGSGKDGKELLWLDGDQEKAQELVAGSSTGVSLEAGEALQQVQEYIQYLGTRNDAQI